MNLKTFATGLVTTDFPDYPKPPFVGKNWEIVYRIDRHQRCHAVYDKKVVRGREIVIRAADKVVAQKAVGLIHASLVLIWPDPLAANQFWVVEDLDANDAAGGKPLFQTSTADLPQACLIACKSSFRRRLSYALHKFLLSMQVFSPDLRSLDPSEGIHHRLSVFADDHVRFAYAIVAAYSAIEELGLEMRVWKEHPSSMINGHWDPAVKADLEARLRKAGVDLQEEMVWQLRGTPTRIERRRQPRPVRKESWARGSVRDCAVELVDAVADASWLRSRVSSHRFSPQISSLSVYDVANIQHLARRLTLEMLGFWKYRQRTAA